MSFRFSTPLHYRAKLSLAFLLVAIAAGCADSPDESALSLPNASSPEVAAAEPNGRGPEASPAPATIAPRQTSRLPAFYGASLATPLAPEVGVPLVEQPASDQSSIVRVFYGTNRRPNPRFGSDLNDLYGEERADLQFGVCAVSLPPSHSYGEIERPSVWRFEFEERPDRHVMLRQVQSVSESRFLQALRSVTADELRQDAFVFVHGYNNDFAEAARRTAQIKHDLNFPGPAILFSWPSRGDVIGYRSDRDQIEPTVPALTRFLTAVSERSGAKRIHVIAHSMGNEFATRAIARVAADAERAGRTTAVFDELVLAAPDIDATEFATTIAPFLTKGCNRCTIYAADHDVALATSRRYNRRPRLGQAGRYLVTFPTMPKLNVVDASKVDFDLFNLGHADFKDDLLGDVRGVLSGLTPDIRRLRPHRVATAWQFIPSAVQPVSYEQTRTASDDASVPPPATEEPPTEQAEDAEDAGLWASLAGWWPF